MRSLRALLLIVFALCASPQTALAYYNPNTGRFLSRDPIQEGDGPNVYAFVRNGPVNAVDPLGQKRIIVLFDGQNFAGIGGKGSLRTHRWWSASSVRKLPHADPDDEVWNTEEDGDWFAVTARKIDSLQRKAKKSCEDPYKIVLVGHSNGGDGARKTARQLNERGWFKERDAHTVDLLFLLDPVAKPWWEHNRDRSFPVSGNVKQAVNWYQRTDPLNIAGVEFQGYLISPGRNNLWNWGAALDPATGPHSTILDDLMIWTDFKERLANVR